MKNKTTKTMQITTDEFKKCKQGQEFKIDVITYSKDKPSPPDGENRKKHFGDGVRKPRKSTAEIVAKTIKELVPNIIKELVPNMIIEVLKPIAATLKEHGREIHDIRRILNKVIDLNNLKH